MKATLVFVPPGGGESEYSLDFELPGVPQPGDYISVTRPGTEGMADFIVRRCWWQLSYPNDELYRDADSQTKGKVEYLLVQCEYALGPHSSEEHKRSVDSYRNQGAQKFERMY